MSLKHIMLVDDSARDIELTLDALAEYNLANEVITFPDGAEALDYLYGRNRFASDLILLPSVILLDLKMPKVSGIEVLRQLKSDKSLRTIPVVVMTSSREERDVVESYELGVNAYVVKPLQFHDFVDAVKVVGAFWGVLNQPPKERSAVRQS